MVGAWKNSSTGRWQLFGSGKLLGAKCITWEDEICFEHRHVGACWSFVSSPVNWLRRTCFLGKPQHFSQSIRIRLKCQDDPVQEMQWHAQFKAGLWGMKKRLLSGSSVHVATLKCLVNLIYRKQVAQEIIGPQCDN